MPLNPRNSRNAHRTVYSGLTEPLTLRRRSSDGSMKDAVEESWVGYVPPKIEQTDFAGVQITNTVRDFWMFNAGCGNPGTYKAPQIGDQIGRRDGSWWDIAPECRIEAKDNANYGFFIQGTRQVIPPVNE